MTCRPDVAALIMGYLHNRARLDAMLPSDGKLQRWERLQPYTRVAFLGSGLILRVNVLNTFLN